MKRSVAVGLALSIGVGGFGLGCTLEGSPSASSANLGPVLQLNEEDGQGATFSWAYYTSIIADGDRVAVAWMNRNGRQNRNVMTRVSTDRAETWSPEYTLNEGKLANTISVVPTLHMLPAENELLALWQSRRNEAGQKFVAVRRSTDFGKTWGETKELNVRMQSFLPVLAQRPDGAILVAWTDERNVQRDIYVNRSLDAGATWLDGDVKVSQLKRSEAGAPALAIGPGEKAYLLWEERPHRQDADGKPHLRFARSKDLGSTWSKPIRVEAVKPEFASPMWPQMIYNGGRLTAVWTGGITGEKSGSWLWMSQSTDGGKTWDEATEIYAGKTQPFFHLVTKGPQVYLVWHGGEGDQPGHIYWNVSDDGGKTWRRAWDAPQRIDRSESSQAFHPRLAVSADSDDVAVTWQEEYARVVVSVSPDLGKSWALEGVTVAAVEDETDKFRNPQVAVTQDAAYVLWERWPDKKKFIKTFADVNKVIPKDDYVRRVDTRS